MLINIIATKISNILFPRRDRKEKAMWIFKNKSLFSWFSTRNDHLLSFSDHMLWSRFSRGSLLLFSGSSDMFCKNDIHKNLQKSQENTCARVSLPGLRPATFLKKRPWHRYFPVNFVKFLRIPIFIEHLWWLLLSFILTKRLIQYKKNLLQLQWVNGNMPYVC